RGTSEICCAEQSVARFIPACAGNICEVRPGLLRLAVHPRVCGEHVDCDSQEAISAGSSPRVRGTSDLSDMAVGTRRFIPACAGNMYAIALANARDTVHPRVCGEHVLPYVPSTHRSGSSPRVRGT